MAPEALPNRMSLSVDGTHPTVHHVDPHLAGAELASASASASPVRPDPP